jgi:hypothetical protein
MTRQKSDRRIVAKDDRKVVPTWGPDVLRGARATTVAKQTVQLSLGFGTAEDQGAQALRADGGAVTHLRKTATRAAPKPNSKKEQVRSATMEEVASGLGQTQSNSQAHQTRYSPKDGMAQHLRWQKSIWVLSHAPAVDRALRNAYFAERGFVSLKVGKFREHCRPGTAQAGAGINVRS